jgi:NADPH:quinone reductase-like Zn-dependent oxidoreductase
MGSRRIGNRERRKWFFCQMSAGQLAEINQLIDEGKLKIHIETLLPLTEAKKAHQLSQSGRTRGDRINSGR